MNRAHRPVRIALVFALAAALVLAVVALAGAAPPPGKGKPAGTPGKPRPRCGEAGEEAVRPVREAVREDEGDALPQGQEDDHRRRAGRQGASAQSRRQARPLPVVVGDNALNARPVEGGRERPSRLSAARASWTGSASRQTSSRPSRPTGRPRRSGETTRSWTPGSSACRRSSRARGRCHDEVTATTSVAPVLRASAAIARALPAVDRASRSAISVTFGPRHAARISSASEGWCGCRAQPLRTTASASVAVCSASARRAAQIGCRPPPRRVE